MHFQEQRNYNYRLCNRSEWQLGSETMQLESFSDFWLIRSHRTNVSSKKP